MLEKGYYGRLHFLSKENKEFVKHGPDPGAGTEPYLTFNDPEMESPFFLTMVTNSKGPTSFLIMVTSGSLLFGGRLESVWKLFHRWC